jgi:hypothetical protein
MQAVFLGVILGILLIIIGIGASSEWVFLIGTLVVPVVLLWGSLFLQEESLPMRIAMLAVVGVSIAATILSVGGWSFTSSSSFW